MLPPISGGAPDADEPKAARPRARHATAPPASAPPPCTMDADPEAEASGESSNRAIPRRERAGRDRRPFPRPRRLGARSSAAGSRHGGWTEPLAAAGHRAIDRPVTADERRRAGCRTARPATSRLGRGSRRPRRAGQESTAGEAAAGGIGRGEPAAPTAPASGRPPRQGKPAGQGRSRVVTRARSPGRQPSAPPPPPSPPQPHPADAQLAQLAYVIVNEAGASVYSTSQVGRDELPEFDATLRGTISIGRRLQDPLSELVKIEPQNIGVGLYQHDVNPKQLKETLESVIASCVNFVGVDLNTASVPLLRHVSGPQPVDRPADRRLPQGARAVRQPRAVDGGRGDRPGHVHPGGRLPQAPRGREPARPHLGSPRELSGRAQAAGEVRVRGRRGARQGPPARAARPSSPRPTSPRWPRELDVGEFTLRDIIEALGRPERDPRDDLPKPIFKKGVLKLEDLTAGMELKGTVLNVVDFGAFVDIGLKDSGLVHISQLANRYVKSPHDVVSVGDVVTVWVMGVDQERKRVSLTMVKPGTERHRGPQGGGARRRSGRRAARPEPGARRSRAGPGASRGGRRPRAAPAAARR